MQFAPGLEEEAVEWRGGLLGGDEPVEDVEEEDVVLGKLLGGLNMDVLVEVAVGVPADQLVLELANQLLVLELLLLQLGEDLRLVGFVVVEHAEVEAEEEVEQAVSVVGGVAAGREQLVEAVRLAVTLHYRLDDLL